MKENENQYAEEIDDIVNAKIVSLVKDDICRLNQAIEEKNPTKLLTVIKEVNRGIYWAAKNDPELYSKYAYHIFKTPGGNYSISQGLEIDTKPKE